MKAGIPVLPRTSFGLDERTRGRSCCGWPLGFGHSSPNMSRPTEPRTAEIRRIAIVCAQGPGLSRPAPRRRPRCDVAGRGRPDRTRPGRICPCSLLGGFVGRCGFRKGLARRCTCVYFVIVKLCRYQRRRSDVGWGVVVRTPKRERRAAAERLSSGENLDRRGPT